MYREHRPTSAIVLNLCAASFLFLLFLQPHKVVSASNSETPTNDNPDLTMVIVISSVIGGILLCVVCIGCVLWQCYKKQGDLRESDLKDKRVSNAYKTYNCSDPRFLITINIVNYKWILVFEIAISSSYKCGFTLPIKSEWPSDLILDMFIISIFCLTHSVNFNDIILCNELISHLLYW